MGYPARFDSRVLGAAGLALAKQSASPVDSSSYGFYMDANGNPVLAQLGVLSGSSYQSGVIASARIKLATQPTANDTVTIGATTFKFVAALGAAVAQVQVLIGASADATRTNLAKAINGDAATAGSTWTEATTPFAGTVVADNITALTQVRIQFASARGGTPVVGPPGSVALSASLTAGTDGWAVSGSGGMSNLNTSGGKAATDAKYAIIGTTVTAAMITAGAVYFELPFTPSFVLPSVLSSTGAMRSTTDTCTFTNGTVKVTLAGGASPAIQANDILVIEAVQ